MNNVIGITGNICTGKSTVANILSGIGAKVLSYDAFLYGAYQDLQCQNEIVNIFGNSVLVDGHIDRTLLKICLKEHPEECKKLWNITDKYLDPKVNEFFRENSGLSFFECAILYEKSWDKFCGQVIACYVQDNLRVRRLMERARVRDGFHLSEDEAVNIVRQQAMPQEEKIRRADYVIYNNRGMDLLEKQTIAIYEKIRRRK